MKHTIGYSTEVSLPVTISYKCSNCGEENIQVVTLKSDFFGSKNNSEKVATEILQKNLDTLITSGDKDELKNIGIYSRCVHCGKAAPWSSSNNSSSKLVAWVIIIAICIVGAFLYKGFTSFSASDLTYEMETFIGISVLVVGVLIIVLSTVLYFVNKTKKRKIPVEARPKIIRIGENEV